MPDEQAEPDETATPARSSAISSVAAAMPGAAKASVLASRGASAPKTTASGRRLAHARLQPIAQPGEPRRFALDFGGGESRRGAEAGDRGDILGAGARAALLTAAAQQRRLDGEVGSHRDHRAHALRAAEFVRREQQEIGAGGCGGQRHPPGAAARASQTTTPPAA